MITELIRLGVTRPLETDNVTRRLKERIGTELSLSYFESDLDLGISLERI